MVGSPILSQRTILPKCVTGRMVLFYAELIDSSLKKPITNIFNVASKSSLVITCISSSMFRKLRGTYPIIIGNLQIRLFFQCNLYYPVSVVEIETTYRSLRRSVGKSFQHPLRDNRPSSSFEYAAWDSECGLRVCFSRTRTPGEGW